MEAIRPSTILPLSAAEAQACFSVFAGQRLLLAVSGGADSIALLGMVAIWAQQSGETVHVAVVDHGLRAGSASEAVFVTEQASRLSLPCYALSWEGEKPRTRLQEAARAARYRLLTEHARILGADAIVTAHTLDDQAETLMMRLAAGSGVVGMAGMQARTMTNGMTHFRPFLGVAKDRLMATCQEHAWPWIEDPSNRNTAFTRVRWRALMPLLAREGLSAERLALFARRMAEAELALQQTAHVAVREAGFVQKRPGWLLDARHLFKHPDALVVRAFANILAIDADETAGSHGPRLARIEICVAAMRTALTEGSAVTRTLGGQLLALKKNGQLAGSPEGVRRRGCVNPVRSLSLGNRPAEN